jgi:hypothetical protein
MTKLIACDDEKKVILQTRTSITSPSIFVTTLQNSLQIARVHQTIHQQIGCSSHSFLHRFVNFLSFLSSFGCPLVVSSHILLGSPSNRLVTIISCNTKLPSCLTRLQKLNIKPFASHDCSN